MPALTAIDGIDRVNLHKLELAGIHSTEELWARGNTIAGRRQLAEQTAIAAGILLDYVLQADFYRIPSIRLDDVILLHAAGIRGVANMSCYGGEALYDRLLRTQRELELGVLPRRDQVFDWIKQARKIQPLVEE